MQIDFDIERFIPSAFARPARWEHSNPIRRLLALFFPLKPNKYVSADMFLLPNGNIYVDVETYGKLKTFLEEKKNDAD